MQVTVPRLLVAGLRGGGGKTLLSLGLAASFRSRGHIVAPFKKGPDYIDASWLSRAAGAPCRNLDLFLLPIQTLLRSFRDGSHGSDISIIEGNRGLFDGMDPEGSYSSGELAKLLKTPVLLSVDVTKTTRTAAAQILGCQTLDPEVPIGGVILNRVAGSRHESVLRESIEGICGIPVLGAIPRLPEDIFPERHLGLVPPQETEAVDAPLTRVQEVAERYLDLEGILDLARTAQALPLNHNGLRWVEELEPRPGEDPEARKETHRARVGVFQDAAFQFYYPENLSELERAGAELVEISPLQDGHLPQVDALYLGGGFPETLALGLSENRSFTSSLREAAEAGLPVYAECGGAVYLGRTLLYEGKAFSMAGVLPVEYGFQPKPRGHGYTVLEAVAGNPFFPLGLTVKGHEFHYTFMMASDSEDLKFAFRMHRGYGFDGQRDGLCKRNVLAAYTHIHALGTPEWAPSLVRAAVRFQSGSSLELAHETLTGPSGLRRPQDLEG